ncbi:hypothetical protein [Streptomyces sp. NPDC051561]|uniref:hypothetical protein n=1 Tax=Streptomyces sp. NPDC051561 TaxID=3365658 RepID=UPI0037B78C20
MTAVVDKAPPVPTSELLKRLDVRLWLDHTNDGRVFAIMLIVHTAPDFDPDADPDDDAGPDDDFDPAPIEQHMLGVAAALGIRPTGRGVAGESAPAHIGRRVYVDGDELRVSLSAVRDILRVPRARYWAPAALGLGQAVVAVGLDELAANARREEVQEYIEASLHAGRMYAAVSDVAPAPGRIAVARRRVGVGN